MSASSCAPLHDGAAATTGVASQDGLMGPITLFDKSFLQSLSIDEAVWFDHFFSPVISPLFYVETLADLEKAVREGRTPEQEVGIIAAKFPAFASYPCVHHHALAVGNLVGHPVPFGRIPIAGGRRVSLDGKIGVVFGESREAEAFARWQDGRFLEIERQMAKEWRDQLAASDLASVAQNLARIGIDARTCSSLERARELARESVCGAGKPFERMAVAMEVLTVPPRQQAAVFERWKTAGYPPLQVFAPFAAHVVEVELFFRFALAGNQIGTARPSNHVDISYLNYLPFAMAFVSTDRLHRRSAPLFLREGQEFVWGPDLKADLARINEHFSTIPEEEREKGLQAIAPSPPMRPDSIVCQLRAKFLGASYDKREPAIAALDRDPARGETLAKQLRRWKDASPAPPGPTSIDDAEAVTLERRLSPKRGSWWQVPKAAVSRRDDEASS